MNTRPLGTWIDQPVAWSVSTQFPISMSENWKIRISITSPTCSPILTRSPMRKGRRVMMNAQPAILAIGSFSDGKTGREDTDRRSQCTDAPRPDERNNHNGYRGCDERRGLSPTELHTRPVACPAQDSTQQQETKQPYYDNGNQRLRKVQLHIRRKTKMVMYPCVNVWHRGKTHPRRSDRTNATCGLPGEPAQNEHTAFTDGERRPSVKLPNGRNCFRLKVEIRFGLYLQKVSRRILHQGFDIDVCAPSRSSRRSGSAVLDDQRLCR